MRVPPHSTPPLFFFSIVAHVGSHTKLRHYREVSSLAGDQCDTRGVGGIKSETGIKEAKL